MKKIVALLFALIFIVSSFTIAYAGLGDKAKDAAGKAAKAFTCGYAGCKAGASRTYGKWQSDNVWTGNGYTVRESRDVAVRCSAGHIYHYTQYR